MRSPCKAFAESVLQGSKHPHPLAEGPEGSSHPACPRVMWSLPTKQRPGCHTEKWAMDAAALIRDSDHEPLCSGLGTARHPTCANVFRTLRGVLSVRGRRGSETRPLPLRVPESSAGKPTTTAKARRSCILIKAKTELEGNT